jgi:hypothetical protein
MCMREVLILTTTQDVHAGAMTVEQTLKMTSELTLPLDIPFRDELMQFVDALIVCVLLMLQVPTRQCDASSQHLSVC